MKKKYIACEWLGDVFALPIGDVIEIVEIEDMIKTTSKQINVSAYRNRIVPVVDPVAMISLDVIKPTAKTRILIVEKKQIRFGILVENVFGAMEFETDEIRDPHMNEKRFVTGITGKVRILEPEAFLTQSVMASFKEILKYDVSILSKGYRIHGHKSYGREELLNRVRIRSLNFLLDASRKKMDDSFVKEAMSIHQLVEKL